MPGGQQLLYYTAIFLQYVFLVLLYIFLYRIVRQIFVSFKTPIHLTRVSAKIVVKDHGNILSSEQEFTLHDSTVIGRSETSDIQIDDSHVSHEHACITYDQGEFVITDLESTNGTYVNHTLITQQLLKNGDEIKIGEVVFKFKR